MDDKLRDGIKCLIASAMLNDISDYDEQAEHCYEEGSNLLFNEDEEPSDEGLEMHVERVERLYGNIWIKIEKFVDEIVVDLKKFSRI